MAILKVARMGHPVLRRAAKPVDPAQIGSPAVQGLIRNMLDTVEEYEGAGLAAPQVHASVRIVVLTLDPDAGMEVWINPVITPTTLDQLESYEGCLSVPGLRGCVRRAAEVHVEALDATGAPISLDLEGFPAIVAQHECDHLDGVLYVDRVERRTLTFTEEHNRWGALLWDASEPTEDAHDPSLDPSDTSHQAEA
ncbi:MAG TPA: peptide deformylase [Deltaproteobacteria bacterium]|nr:peptide deformylase [Deltaproteobacteria bacterium]